MLRDNLAGLIVLMQSSGTQALRDEFSYLENPRPVGTESSLTGRCSSPFQTEPRHDSRTLGTTVKVPIENLYYLFCYAWRYIPNDLAFDVGADESSDVLNLCAHLLNEGIDRLLRRGIERGYVRFNEESTRVRGRLDLNDTIRHLTFLNARRVCQFEELSPNITSNQILRSTVKLLLNAPINSKLRDKLQETNVRLSSIETIPLSASLFHRVQLNRNNGSYAFLIRVCELVHLSFLPDRSGEAKSWFRDVLSDEQYMSAVFEEFIRNFYDLKQPNYSVSRTQPKWNAIAAKTEDLKYLPSMLTDVTLISPERHIIIDAKYYRDALQAHYDSKKVHSSNLYQLLAYLRATEHEFPKKYPPEGILIYPVNGDPIDLKFKIDGHLVRIYTLNLNQSPDELERDLLGLVTSSTPTSVSTLNSERDRIHAH
jgi:5-methylcytosine-specific restriction enzyme subunit McrC